MRAVIAILLLGLLAGCGGAAARVPTSVPPTALPQIAAVATLGPSGAATGPTIEPLSVNTFPEDKRFGDDLRFETIVDRPELVREVQFTIVDVRGQVVHQKVERTPRYCVFGGGENGADCPTWSFASHGGRWPDGAQAESGATYTLMSVVIPIRGEPIRQQHVFVLELP